jgi:hypothetical protein
MSNCYPIACSLLHHCSFDCTDHGSQVFTGRPPFADIAMDIVVVMHVINGKRPARPSANACLPGTEGIPEDIWLVVTELWQQSPDHRPHMESVRHTLHDFYALETIRQGGRSDTNIFSAGIPTGFSNISRTRASTPDALPTIPGTEGQIYHDIRSMFTLSPKSPPQTTLQTRIREAISKCA